MKLRGLLAALLLFVTAPAIAQVNPGTQPLSIAKGGTGKATAPLARSSSGLNIDQFTGRGDSNYAILATDRTVGTNAAFTASRTWTLPAANAVNAGQEIVVADFQGTVTGSNTLVIQRAGSDTVNGTTGITISAANGAYLFKSDGTSKWTAQALGAAAGGGVSNVTCNNGLTGGTITTSGTCALDPLYLRGYISGLTLSNDGVSPLTVIDIAAGVATADDQTSIMKLASAYTKTFSAWTVGSGVGGLDTGSLASNVTYHLFLIQRSDTGVTDILISQSATSPTMPTNYNRKRRLGAILTAGTNIRGFVQIGNEFILKASQLDVSGSGMSVTPGNATLTVPNGVVVKARIIARNNAGVATTRLWVYTPQMSDEAASATEAISVLSSTTAILTPLDVWTDVNRNVRVVADVATGTYDIRTFGWLDPL